jgi:hypothetical protein
VYGTNPGYLQPNVSATTDVLAKFSEQINPKIVNSATFQLVRTDPFGRVVQIVNAAVSYDAASQRATLDPATDLKAAQT